MNELEKYDRKKYPKNFYFTKKIETAREMVMNDKLYNSLEYKENILFPRFYYLNKNDNILIYDKKIEFFEYINSFYVDYESDDD